MNTMTDHVAELHRWAEYEERFPTLSVPYRERTLAQHIECWSIQDLIWRRLSLLGVRDMGDRLRACAARLGCTPEDKPSDELLAYLQRLMRVTYDEVWQERGPETKAFARAHGFPVMR